MKRSIKFLTFCLILISLSSCHNQCNKWTDKDCEYRDYYQSPPLRKPDTQYYHSDPI